jgi:phage shock protein C
MPGKKAPKRKSRRKEEVPDQRFEHFGEEVGKLGEKFGKRMEYRGREWESWFHRTFGIVGPFISGILGLVIFSLLIWLVSLVNVWIDSTFLSDMNIFLFANIGLFFLIFLFFSYTSYFSKAYPRSYRPLSPVVVAIGITIGFWIAMQAIDISNLSLGIPALSAITFYIGTNLNFIFLFFAILGYLILAIKVTLEIPKVTRVEEVTRKIERTRPENVKPVGIHRLYRSGNDRIIGGVCGGIAEYLGVDPVIIRLLWVIGTLAAMGFGVIVYIICWIIIPRNPRHKWKD